MKHYGLEEVYDGMLNEFRFYGTSKQNFGDYRELFFNPSNNDSTILDIIKAFRDSGGEVGEGISQYVFMRPEWDFVVKLYCDDSSYKKFIRLAKTAKDKTHFPRILQRHENVIPNFERPPSWSKVNIIVMEKLEEVSVKEYNSIKNFFKAAESYFLSLKDFLNTPTDFWYKGEMLKNRQAMQNEFKALPKTKRMMQRAVHNLYHRFFIINKTPTHDSALPDFHQGNIMKRPKGKGYELVLTDPFFNPIHAALRSNTSKYITLHSEIINLGGTIRLVRGGETLNDYEKRMEGYKKDLMLQREVSVLAKEISQMHGRPIERRPREPLSRLITRMKLYKRELQGTHAR